VIQLGDDAFQVVLNERRGGEVVHVGPRGQNVLAEYEWQAPVESGPATTYGNSRADWLASYRGGWQTLLPNAGDEGVVDGVLLPFHGEWSRTPTVVIERTRDRVVLEAGARLPLTCTMTVELVGSTAVRVGIRLRNDAPFTVPYVLVSHPAFDVEGGARIDLPQGQFVAAESDGGDVEIVPGSEGRWPHLPAVAGGEVDVSRVGTVPVERMCYMPDVAQAWAALHHDGLTVGMAWSPEAYRHLWIWQEVGGRGFPWFGRAAIAAIEPASCWPADGLEAARGRGQASQLPPGQVAESWVVLSVSSDTGSAVVGVYEDGSIERGDRP